LVSAFGSANNSAIRQALVLQLLQVVAVAATGVGAAALGTASTAHAVEDNSDKPISTLEMVDIILLFRNALLNGLTSMFA
jgi:hypothetical protein